MDILKNGKEAMYYEKIENGKVHCCLCPHHCVIKPEGWGACRARKNMEGHLFSMNYGKVASLAMDPIEKKPLYRFMPGSYILSTGSFGCNLKCSFCQNWSIAHKNPATYFMTPEELVGKAAELKAEGNIGIAYTYNEPSIWYEYVLDCAKLAKKAGLVNVLVSNGFITPEALRELLPFVDAMNIDVKAFTTNFYENICRGVLDNVKETVEIAAKACHVEVTTLVIPDLNDSAEEINLLSEWLSTVSPDIPLHLSRFFPNYLMQGKPVTPVETLVNAKKVADRYLKHVYLGNV